jgi:hypothetical protein
VIIIRASLYWFFNRWNLIALQSSELVDSVLPDQDTYNEEIIFNWAINKVIRLWHNPAICVGKRVTSPFPSGTPLLLAKSFHCGVVRFHEAQKLRFYIINCL